MYMSSMGKAGIYWRQLNAVAVAIPCNPIEPLKLTVNDRNVEKIIIPQVSRERTPSPVQTVL